MNQLLRVAVLCTFVGNISACHQALSENIAPQQVDITLSTIELLKLDIRSTQVQSPEEIVRACTIAIQDSHLQQRDREHLLQLRGLSYLTLRQPNLALVDLEECQAKNLSNPTQQWLYARALAQTGKVMLALTECKKLVKQHPEFSAGYATMGAILVGKQRFDEAILMLDHAIKLAPESQYPFHIRATAYLFQSRLKEALQDSNKSFQNQPDEFALAQSDLHLKRAQIYRVMKRFQESANDYSQVLKSRPDHFESHFGIWKAARIFRQFELAASQTDILLKLRPESADALYAATSTYPHIGRHRKAEELARKWVSRNPAAIQPRISLAVALDLADKDHEALQVLDQLILDRRLNEKPVEKAKAIAQKAWLLTTSRDQNIRNPNLAITLSEGLVGRQETAFTAHLIAAYAWAIQKNWPAAVQEIAKAKLTASNPIQELTLKRAEQDILQKRIQIAARPLELL